MATLITVDPPPAQPASSSEVLTAESLPMVDLRVLSQSELGALSLCSSGAFDLRRCDDVVIPKIDRTVFNESAGSRKQTYSRLRLAPRNANNNNIDVSSKNKPPPSPERADNSRIIALFNHLFNHNNDSTTLSVLPPLVSDTLVPVTVEYADDVSFSSALVPVSVFVEGEDDDVSLRRKRKASEEPVPLAILPADEERERALVNRSGVEVDLQELGKAEDPYREELKRRTQGRESAEELLELMGDLDGEWGSRRKKRKLVDANLFGDALPNGWKLLLALKKKHGLACLYCRRYVRLFLL